MLEICFPWWNPATRKSMGYATLGNDSCVVKTRTTHPLPQAVLTYFARDGPLA